MKLTIQKDTNGHSIKNHKTDLKEAIFYLPRNVDQETLFRAIKQVYPHDGFEIALEWLYQSKNKVPANFKDRWADYSLTKYQQHTLDDWLKQNIYDIAEKTGWVPKGLRHGKQTKKPPSKCKQSQLAAEIDSEKKLPKQLIQAREHHLPDDEKSYISPGIHNMLGGCYFHPFIKKDEIPQNEADYKRKLTKLVDCEVRIQEACEYVVEKYGREPDEIQVKYRIELTNRKDKYVVAQVTHEELTTKTRFSSFLVSKGFVKFQGDTKEFDKFHRFLLKEQSYPTVRVPASWGEYKPGVFLFENGIYCTQSGKFFEAGDEQRISYNNKLIVCPNGSQQVMPPRLRQVEPTTEHFLFESFSLWESFNGPLNVRSTIGYAVGCLFSREIMEKLRGVPILFKFGIRGTGKSTSMDWFMALFGYRDGNRQSVSKQNTLKGLNRRMTLPRSFPFFLDDFRNKEGNSNVPDMTSSFLNWFQRIGTGMADKTVDQSTVDTHMKACVVMTGNDKPIDPAALSRLIVLNFNRHIKGNQIQEVRKIADHTERLSEFLALLLDNYDRVRKVFFDFLEIHREYLSKKNFEGRTVNNWSIILAGVETIKLILPKLGWHEEMDKYREEVCNAIRKEQELEHSQSRLIEFFDTLNFYASEKKHPQARFDEDWFMLDRRHFQITEYSSKDPSNEQNEYTGPAIALHLPGIWSVLKDTGADITRSNTRSTIEARIQNSKLFLERSAHVYMFESHKSLKKKTRRCYLLNLQALKENGLLDDLIDKAQQYIVNS
ncbi:MAG: hypothetical protein JJU13_06075 [Balneolaceae bacterium]|nr:hypothetical protein [Balneolaceae bacterium]